MKATTTISLSLIVAATLLEAACSRELPSQWPTSSPASPGAAELPPAAVTLAVDGDPPLPGEAADGWIGLEPPATTVDSPHGGHQHKVQPDNHAEPPSSSGGGHDNH